MVPARNIDYNTRKARHRKLWVQARGAKEGVESGVFRPVKHDRSHGPEIGTGLKIGTVVMTG